MILEDQQLLPVGQLSPLELTPDRLQDPGVVAEVLTKAIGQLPCDDTIAYRNGLLCGSLQRADRDETVDEQGCDRGNCDESGAPAALVIGPVVAPTFMVLAYCTVCGCVARRRCSSRRCSAASSGFLKSEPIC